MKKSRFAEKRFRDGGSHGDRGASPGGCQGTDPPATGSEESVKLNEDKPRALARVRGRTIVIAHAGS